MVTGTFHQRPVEIAGATSVALDVRDAEAVAAVFDRARPDAVVHTAYVKGTETSETTIVAGTSHIAAAARRHGARLVHMSTDAVFAGRPEPYGVEDRVDPVDDYGRAKAAAERVAGGDGRAVIVRSSLLYSVVRPCPVVQMVTEAGPDSRFFVDEYRCPTLVEDLAVGLVRLAAEDTSGVVHLNAAEAVSRYEFACLIAAHYGMATDTVTAGTAAAYGAPRPGRLVLTPSVRGYRGVSEVLTRRSS